MSLRFLALVGFATFVLAACSIEPDEAFPELTPAAEMYPELQRPSTGPVELHALRVGQTARYRYFTTTGYPTHLNEDVRYADDTLVLRVVGEDDRGFRVVEYLEAGSASLTGRGELINPDSVYSYYLRPDGAAVDVLPRGQLQLRSRLFGYRSHDFPRLVLTTATNADVSTGWDGEWCACEKTARAERVRIAGITYPELRLLLDNTETRTDGLGLLFHYDPSGTFVRHGFLDPQANRAYGWDLLAE